MFNQPFNQFTMYYAYMYINMYNNDYKLRFVERIYFTSSSQGKCCSIHETTVIVKIND